MRCPHKDMNTHMCVCRGSDITAGFGHINKVRCYEVVIALCEVKIQKPKELLQTSMKPADGACVHTQLTPQVQFNTALQ